MRQDSGNIPLRQAFNHNFLARLSKPLCKQLSIPIPHFHSNGFIPFFGETKMIGPKVHVFISRIKNRSWPELLDTLTHELIHCWQFNRGIYSPALENELENQALRLTPIFLPLISTNHEIG